MHTRKENGSQNVTHWVTNFDEHFLLQYAQLTFFLYADLLKDKNVWDPNFGLKKSRTKV